jgi:hypothetical protein
MSKSPKGPDKKMSASQLGDLEEKACTPASVDPSDFNESAVLPLGCGPKHIYRAMTDFADFLGFVNTQLYTKQLQRLESMVMPANFSSMVGEFMSSGIPKYCESLVKNRYHNGHPDLIPKGAFPNDAIQHSGNGIEIKASRYQRAWQGHNAEDTWLMVFVFDSNRPVDPPDVARPFRFLLVAGAPLTKADWIFSGRSGESRRTITASVTDSGSKKMMANWIYKARLL